MSDIVMIQKNISGTLEGGLKATVDRYARELNSKYLRSFIQQYAE